MGRRASMGEFSEGNAFTPTVAGLNGSSAWSGIGGQGGGGVLASEESFLKKLAMKVLKALGLGAFGECVDAILGSGAIKAALSELWEAAGDLFASLKRLKDLIKKACELIMKAVAKWLQEHAAGAAAALVKAAAKLAPTGLPVFLGTLAADFICQALDDWLWDLFKPEPAR